MKPGSGKQMSCGGHIGAGGQLQIPIPFQKIPDVNFRTLIRISHFILNDLRFFLNLCISNYRNEIVELNNYRT